MVASLHLFYAQSTHSQPDKRMCAGMGKHKAGMGRLTRLKTMAQETQEIDTRYKGGR
jgi:hypothetical protein